MAPTFTSMPTIRPDRSSRTMSASHPACVRKRAMWLNIVHLVVDSQLPGSRAANRKLDVAAGMPSDGGIEDRERMEISALSCPAGSTTTIRRAIASAYSPSGRYGRRRQDVWAVNPDGKSDSRTGCDPPRSRHKSNTYRGLQNWAEADLNRRHTDFQSVALPTELPARTVSGTPANRKTHEKSLTPDVDSVNGG